ncbi:neuropeptide CCHamide-1 receptor-like isoform X2 [Acanthaster planci]|nr:neuropeptide CCHamide-1 receptor-like isoform X2 [Acanthaster planci]XP_022111777.1 neuropeptide CCHamide-1 receptor-like isoform X2 [Acanthaster planci]
MLKMPWKWNLIVMLIMAVYGTIVNLALLMVILSNQHLRTVSNTLVGNLALADTIMFVFSVPSDLVHHFVLNWPDNSFGNFLCKVSGSSWSLAMALSVASLTAVSIERFCSICWNVHAKRYIFILLIVWLFSLSWTVPVLVWSSVVRYGPYLSICHVLPWWHDYVARGFFTAGFVLKYVIPLLVITCCYVGTAITLAQSTPASSVTVRARRRLAIVVLILNISFAICWLPNHAIILHFFYGDIYETYKVSYALFLTFIEIAHVLVYVNSLLNPIVVFTISDAHRKPLVHFVRSRLCRQAPASNRLDRYAEFDQDGIVSETECVDVKT